MKKVYGSLIEQWKVDLIIERAKWRRFRRHEIEEALQEIVQEIHRFNFDSTKSNGACEKTVLTSLIDKRLSFYERSRARRHKHEDRYRVLSGQADGKPAPDPLVTDHEDQIALSLDVQQALACLGQREQTVCTLLIEGKSKTKIANALDLTRYEVDRIILSIREQFETLGIDGWLSA